MRRTDSAIIGDVHGCSEELEELLDALLENAPRRRIRLVGDLLTRGPDPAGVVSLIRDLQSAGVDIRSVCGNHDIRLFKAMRRCREGLDPAKLPKNERNTIRRLGDEAHRNQAFDLLAQTVERIRSKAGPATVIHGGIDPALGLEGTTPHELIHRKAGAGERPWWDDYDGRDGLIVVGHKPVKSPVRVTRDGRPVAVNVDTGCAAGGRLTAYLVEADDFIAVESRQVTSGIDRNRIEITNPDHPEFAIAG